MRCPETFHEEKASKDRLAFFTGKLPFAQRRKFCSLTNPGKPVKNIIGSAHNAHRAPHSARNPLRINEGTASTIFMVSLSGVHPCNGGSKGKNEFVIFSDE